jgi:hypothetical protein
VHSPALILAVAQLAQAQVLEELLQLGRAIRARWKARVSSGWAAMRPLSVCADAVILVRPLAHPCSAGEQWLLVAQPELHLH